MLNPLIHANPMLIISEDLESLCHLFSIFWKTSFQNYIFDSSTSCYVRCWILIPVFECFHRGMVCGGLCPIGSILEIHCLFKQNDGKLHS